ncbi:peptide deformylase, partial [Nocardioides sp.]|uniref:peptide deformylase n=1 Tax=Nocardioides sp. TaxID=35761 RepID=UPI002B264F26
MAIQPIRLFGDPVLRSKAIEVVDFDKELRTLVADLTDTMLEAPGAGLAAPQIGVGLRVFTWNVDGEVGHLVNPDLTLSVDEQDGPEGCLSLPDLTYDCRRALSVVRSEE